MIGWFFKFKKQNKILLFSYWINILPKTMVKSHASCLIYLLFFSIYLAYYIFLFLLQVLRMHKVWCCGSRDIRCFMRMNTQTLLFLQQLNFPMSSIGCEVTRVYAEVFSTEFYNFLHLIAFFVKLFNLKV